MPFLHSLVPCLRVGSARCYPRPMAATQPGSEAGRRASGATGVQSSYDAHHGEHVSQSLIERDLRGPLEIDGRQRRVSHERLAVDATDLRGIYDKLDLSLRMRSSC